MTVDKIYVDIEGGTLTSLAEGPHLALLPERWSVLGGKSLFTSPKSRQEHSVL